MVRSVLVELMVAGLEDAAIASGGGRTGYQVQAWESALKLFGADLMKAVEAAKAAANAEAKVEAAKKKKGGK